MEKISEIENMVDGLGQPKASVTHRKKSNKTLKVIGAIAIVAMLCTVAVATYLTYFAQFNKELTVTQSITVDGHNWNQPFAMAGTISAGCCEIDGPHTVTNNGCEGMWLDFVTTETSDPVQSLDGIAVSIKACDGAEPPVPCYLTTLQLNALDGVNENNDDFTVEVNGVLVYTYDAIGGGVENWVSHDIDLTSFAILCDDNNIVNITATSPMWQYFNPYGQLGIDSVALFCDNGCLACPEELCGSVDIGNQTSEAGYAMVGWGPIEPATHGGTYGGIADCRTTWFYELVVGQPMTDAPWATITIPCDCVLPTFVAPNGCTCATPDKTLPFYLGPGESLDFCIAYKADMLLQPNIYNIQTLLIPGVKA